MPGTEVMRANAVFKTGPPASMVTPCVGASVLLTVTAASLRLTLPRAVMAAVGGVARAELRPSSTETWETASAWPLVEAT